MQKKYVIFVIFSLFCGASYADSSLTSAIANVRAACAGIGDELTDMKKMAGINTAVTGVGTVAGGVALGTGLAKVGVDEDYSELKKQIEQKMKDSSDVTIEQLEVMDMAAFNAAIDKAVEDAYVSKEDKEKLNNLEQQSKTLGNVRTGTLAVSAVTNIAGTAMAVSNKVDESLEEKITKCIVATNELANARMIAKVDNSATDAELITADKIVNACREYELVDISPINKRATGAAVASGVGAGSGIVGTITSAMSNTDTTRSGDDEKEKTLNTTANVMSGVSTVASAAATIFNATQISAIKKLVAVSEICEGALK